MDRFEQHLQTIPIGLIVAVVGVAILFVVLVPKRIGFYTSLFLMGAWVNLNRFTAIPFLSSASKLTFWLPPVMVILFSLFLPGARKRIPTIFWPYLLCPIWGAICVLGTVDRIQAVTQFFAMLIISAAALALYRVTITFDDLRKHLSFFALGVFVPIAIAFFALVVHRAAAFRLGVNRFEPYGMLSNQYVHLFATTCCLAGCGYLTLRSPWQKLLCLGAIGSCGAMLLASGSRQGLVIVSLSLLPAAWQVRRKPLAIAFAVVAAILVGGWLMKHSDNISSDRITDFSHTSGRYELALEYLDVIAKRPLTGLLGTKGQLAGREVTAENIPHDAYIKMAYTGGAILLFPLLAAAAVTLYSCYVVLRNADRTTVPPVVLWSLAALLLAIYIQGMVNDMIYVSFSSWPFIHFFLSCFFVGMKTELERQPSNAWANVAYPQAVGYGSR